MEIVAVIAGSALSAKRNQKAFSIDDPGGRHLTGREKWELLASYV